MTEIATLLTAYASLPEPRQPAWGLGVGHDATQRAYTDRVAMIVPLLQALPCDGSLRVLDLSCAQGYFTLAVAHELAARGRKVEIVGIDRRVENIRFCEALAAHHGIRTRFVCASFDADFLRAEAASSWDVVLVFGIAGPDDAVDVVSALPAHARVALSDRALVGHAFTRRLAPTATLPESKSSGLYVGSDSMAWVGGSWFAFDRIADRSHAGVPDAFAGERRFFIGTDTVVKAFRGDGRYGRFNRAELANEVDVLLALAGEPACYPAVLAQADDGDVIWLARGALPGELLSEQLMAGDVDRDAIACGLLAELAHLQALGFHHGDLRCWNCLVDGETIRLIDFGAMVRTGSPLQRLALAAVLLELTGKQAEHEQPFYACVHPVAAYPPAWQPLVRYLLGAPQAAFSYAEAQHILATSLGQPVVEPIGVSANLEPDGELLSAATREHCEAFQRLRQHSEAVERSLAGEERARAAQLAETSGLHARVRELERAQQAAEQSHTEYVGSLRAEIESSHAYATSLRATLDRERVDARAALEAMEAARRVAVEYAESLVKTLDETKRHADFQAKELDAAKRHAASQAAQLAWMRHRFCWLKPLWPRQPDDSKDPE
jgi:tRNA A-37 threonylcarbamoyl transferase component Bud32